MLNPETLVGMPVVGTEDADKVGYVSDLYFGVEPLRVAALRVSGDLGDLVVAYDCIASIGHDAITIRDAGAAETTAAAGRKDLLASDGLLGALKILDDEGNYLGTVTSVEVEPQSGTVERLSSERGGVLGFGAERRTFDAAAIRHVGREIVTVREAASP